MNKDRIHGKYEEISKQPNGDDVEEGIGLGVRLREGIFRPIDFEEGQMVVTPVYREQVEPVNKRGRMKEEGNELANKRGRRAGTVTEEEASNIAKLRFQKLWGSMFDGRE